MNGAHLLRSLTLIVLKVRQKESRAHELDHACRAIATIAVIICRWSGKKTDVLVSTGITRESPSKGYFPFGYSTRSCIGATLALIEGTVMISLLTQKYTFHEVRAESIPCLRLDSLITTSHMLTLYRYWTHLYHRIPVSSLSSSQVSPWFPAMVSRSVSNGIMSTPP